MQTSNVQTADNYDTLFHMNMFFFIIKEVKLELVSKELNYLRPILHVYAGGLIFIN